MSRKPPKNRTLSPEEAEIWAFVTQHVKAYARQTTVRDAAPSVPPVRQRTLPAPESPAPLARLDLHGMTQAGAFSALERFIEASARRNYKNALIITGKGKGGEGVLKKMLPLWLERPSLARHIRSLEQAPPKLGGGGAFLVYFKKGQGRASGAAFD